VLILHHLAKTALQQVTDFLDVPPLAVQVSRKTYLIHHLQPPLVDQNTTRLAQMTETSNGGSSPRRREGCGSTTGICGPTQTPRHEHGDLSNPPGLFLEICVNH
jgi:hypothetical protein